MIKTLIEKSRYLSLVSVFGMLAGAVAALFFGVVKTVKVFQISLTNINDAEPMLYALFDALDFFLVATALIVIAVSLYELFIGVLEVPDWMLVTDLTELKAKFTFVIIPVMAVKFVQKILRYENAVDTFYFGAAIGIVALSLTAFNFVSLKEKKEKAKELENPNLHANEKRAKDV